MNIIWREESRTFHLYNDQVSYIMKVLRCGQLGQLYFGKRVHDRDDFSYLLENLPRPMASCTFEDSKAYSLEHIKQEYPSYGTGDYRSPAVEILQENGSRISAFVYKSHRISDGKPSLEGLPATYTEDDSEARTLTVTMEDAVTGMTLELSYTIFAQGGIIARSARFVNRGEQPLHLTTAMSLCLDLPDHDYAWMQFSGAWARERYPRVRRLEEGILSVGSRRGHSSHEHNPFIILKRPQADEFQGEAIGFSLVYSGNFLAQAEVGSHDTTRVLMGIHPDGFDWKLEPKEAFQTPEAVMVYTDRGLNDLSQTFHRLYQKRLARGYWRDRERPILINNWEATYFDFTEGKILEIAGKARECGVEMFVLDDGWFGKRCSDRAGLGDWVANRDRLPGGIAGLAQKIDDMGMKFGLWFEPEMVNKDSNLYREHPDWILSTPGRHISHGRNQYILDFSRAEVVDAIYGQMEKILEDAPISYIKWDMNRCMSEVYSHTASAADQGKVMHQYILGVYRLYEKLTGRFPEILFESCASGGSRFDPGLLYYAPQAWTSDDTDAVERCKIQYGTSLVYPVSSMGSHVSAVPNHQVLRNTSLKMRADVAYFGTFGYELNPNSLTEAEREAIKKQTAFMKEHRSLIQYGTFYRLQSPFAGNEMAWMVVSEDKKEAIVGWYRFLEPINIGYRSVRLQGLDPKLPYQISDMEMALYGDELMQAGLIVSDVASGQNPEQYNGENGDFQSLLYLLKAKEE